LLLHALLHPEDRDGGILLLATLFGMYPFLKKLFADGGYQGPEFQKALAKILPYLETEIVKRSDHAKGFVVLPRRWIVERTIAWLNRCRRLAKDWENVNTPPAKAGGFRLRLEAGLIDPAGRLVKLL
jgi:putative transposase